MGKQEYLLLDKYKPLCESAALRWEVSPEIHPEDFLFQFVLNHPFHETEEKAIEAYFADGANSARTLHRILTEICGFGKNQIHLLEFASGYGYVTRHIKNTLPFCLTTACDIHQQAVQFIQEKLGIEAILSASRPEAFHVNKTFDVVFALSFFSHMPKNTFARWLKTLTSFIPPEGYCIFTTHGLASRKYFPKCQFDAEGFYFEPTSEQKDLSLKEYGSTIVKPQYVFERIFETCTAGPNC
jgi:SAM-dependent methyltransferase